MLILAQNQMEILEKFRKEPTKCIIIIILGCNEISWTDSVKETQNVGF